MDTNIIAYMCLGGPWTQAAERLREEEAEWCAPLLWRSEFRSVIGGQLRRKLLDLSEAMEAAQRAESLIASHEVGHERVLRLVVASRCSAYDLEYVALAQQLQVPLVTMDRELLRAFPDVARPLAS